ncbi:MAG: hypothetical protein E7430_00515 [Ruminococcaceae bacterium]|nr:hypothetical protein [Oscillospiraceae bacterium]
MADKEKLVSKIKSDPDMSQILMNKDKLSSVLNSDDGRKLISILSQDGGAALKKAANAISAGNNEEAKRVLEPLMNRPETQHLVDELNRKVK